MTDNPYQPPQESNEQNLWPHRRAWRERQVRQTWQSFALIGLMLLGLGALMTACQWLQLANRGQP